MEVGGLASQSGAHNKAGVASVGMGTRKAHEDFYSALIYTVTRKHSRGTLGTAHTRLYTPTSQRGPSQAISHCTSRPSIGKSFFRTQQEAWGRAIAGAQAEVAGACVPVCPSLAMPPGTIDCGAGVCMRGEYEYT